VPTAPIESISYFSKAAPTAGFGTYRGSPPPPSYDSSSSEDSASDPFNPDSPASDRGADGEFTDLTRPNDVSFGVPSGSNDHRAMDSGNRTSLNTLDSQRAISFEPTYPSNVEGRPGEKRKSVLDVDAFTRLLLTGDAGTQPETTTSSKGDFSNQPHFDSGLASDSSSMSAIDTPPGPRPSIEPRLGAAVSTPSTSHETSTSEADEMRSASQSRSISEEKKPKPPPPKTRHGKLINPEGLPPARSAEALPSSSLSHLQRSPSETSISVSSEHRSSLPSPPLVKSSPTLSDDTGMMDEASPLKRAPSQLKKPPTPPLTRRHSQMKHSSKAPFRDHPRRISLPPAGLGLQVAGPTSPGLKNPPRPPSRRHDKSLSVVQSEAFAQPKSPLSRDPSTPWSFSLSEDSETGAPSPPLRIPSVKRTPPASVTTGSNMPPPPPPPRRMRASSKSSTGSAYAPSMQSDREDERGDETLPHLSNASDILADLTRLQKEVDDLRGHYESRKASH
jgi:hypothetical protein